MSRETHKQARMSAKREEPAGRTVLHEASIADAVKQDWQGEDWRWFASFSFPRVNSLEGAEQRKRRFFQLLHGKAKQAIAARGWFFRYPHNHIHLVLASGNPSRPLFPDVIGDDVEGRAYWSLQEAWKREMGYMSGCSLDIRPISSLEGLIDYIAGPRNVSRPNQQFEYLLPVNARILNKMGL